MAADFPASLGIGWAAFALCSLTLLLAAFTHTVTAQAFGVVAAPIVTLIAPERVPATILMLAVCITALGAWRHARTVAMDEFLIAISGRVFGTILASLIFLLLPGTEGISVAVAVTVLLAVAISLCGVRLSVTRNSLAAAGTLSGLMSAFTSVGMPPMSLLYQHEDASRIRGTLNLYLLAGTIVSLTGLLPHGLLTTKDVFFALSLLPSVILGRRIGLHFAARIEGRSLRPAVLFIASVAAITILARVAWS